MTNMKNLFEKKIIDGQSPLYFGIWTYNGRMFKITSSLKNGLSTWKIEVRTTTGKWTFETGNLIFEDTLASYTQNDVGINIQSAFSNGIDVAERYIKSVYNDPTMKHMKK